jgi:hypothetical protein
MRVGDGQAPIGRAAERRSAGLPRSVRRYALVAGLVPALASCGDGDRAGPIAGQPYRLSGPACVRMLNDRGIAVQSWRPASGSGCAVDTPVRASAGTLAGFSPPLETSCAMLVAWSDFEAEVDAAARRFLGSRLLAVRHFGSFGCRRMTGNAGRLSLHAKARALDISGFQLADGRVVTVLDGWRGPRDQRRFLRAVADAACRHFSVTLTPESDRLHQNHLHVDIGPWRRCGL